MNMANPAQTTPSLPNSLSMIPISVKLDDDNFLTWKMQALGTIKAHKLQKFISEADSGGMPQKFLNNEDELLGKINTAYENWEQQDSYVFTWLLASMSQNLHTRMVGCEFAYQIWKKLQVHFATQTRAKVCQLKTQLRSIKKTNSMNEYLLSIKKVVDTLVAVGSPIDNSEHVQIILDGLPSEYDSIVTSIISRNDDYSMPDIEALLLTMEERVERHKVATSDAFSMQPLQANLVQHQQHQQFSRNYNSRAPNYNSNRGGNGNFRGGYRGRGRNSSRGGGRQQSWQQPSNKPQCQICERYGHLASNCWYRYDDQNQDPRSNNQNRAMLAENSNTENSCMLAVPETLYDPSWYPDSGATNHLTPNDANLMQKAVYNGDSRIKLADGASTSIDHIGN